MRRTARLGPAARGQLHPWARSTSRRTPTFLDFLPQAKGLHNSYYLHHASCVFHLTNDPRVGMLEFRFEGTVLTDAEDRSAIESDLEVELVARARAGGPSGTIRMTSSAARLMIGNSRRATARIPARSEAFSPKKIMMMKPKAP